MSKFNRDDGWVNFMAKKILITGAAGFIGSHLCELFVKGFRESEHW